MPAPHDRGGRQDERESGEVETDSTRAQAADVHRHLGRVRTGNQVGDADEINQLRVGQPSPAFDHLPPHERDMRGRSPESDEPERAEDHDQLTQSGSPPSRAFHVHDCPRRSEIVDLSGTAARETAPPGCIA